MEISFDSSTQFSHQPVDNKDDLSNLSYIETTQFNQLSTQINSIAHIQDILLAHKVTTSGLPNKEGCRIPLNTNWNLLVFQELLEGYHDLEVLQWLKYGFSISRDDSAPDPTPASSNHLGATLYPQVIDKYVANEVKLGASIGPFTILPFLHRIGISPCQHDPKERRARGELSWTSASQSGLR